MPAPDPLGPSPERLRQLPLFPLRSVLFPRGALWLTVVEPRYRALLHSCLQRQEPFGALCVREGEQLEDIGVLAHVAQIGSRSNGSAERVRCLGHQRFRVVRERSPGDDGLRRAKVVLIADDPPLAPLPAMFPVVQALGRALTALRADGKLPADEATEFDSAAWVANRWCELLPIPLQAKQRLMALTDPAVRLALVDRYLRDQRVIS